MAQAVERILGKDEVASSILASSSKKGTCVCRCFFYMINPAHLEKRRWKKRYVIFLSEIQ